MLPLESARLLADHDLWPPTHHTTSLIIFQARQITKLCQVYTRLECDQSQLWTVPRQGIQAKSGASWCLWSSVTASQSMLLFFP